MAVEVRKNMADPAERVAAIGDCATETQWRDGWSRIQSKAGADDADLATIGGASADRFAWVFMSGYQAAVRRCFPEFSGDGWSCFAAAEPGDGRGCVLETAAEGFRLQGQKSWIAGAGHVEKLVCSVGEGDDRRFAGVDRHATGVSVSMPRTPSFLAELTQGAAAFDDVAVAASEVLFEPVRAHWFRAAEPLFVLLALNACLAAHGQIAGGRDGFVRAADAAIEHGKQLADHIAVRDVIKPGLSELRTRTSAVVDAFEADILDDADQALQRSWRTDGRLLNMFGLRR